MSSINKPVLVLVAAMLCGCSRNPLPAEGDHANASAKTSAASLPTKAQVRDYHDYCAYLRDNVPHKVHEFKRQTKWKALSYEIDTYLIRYAHDPEGRFNELTIKLDPPVELRDAITREVKIYTKAKLVYPVGGGPICWHDVYLYP